MLSVTGFLTVVCMGSLLIALLCAFAKNNRLLARAGTGWLVATSVAVMLRLFIPAELGFETSVYSTQILTRLCDLLNMPLAVGRIRLRLSGLLCAVWCAGSLVMVVRSAVSSLCFHRMLRESETACDSNALKALHALYAGRRSRARFRLLQTPLANTPMVMGLLWHVIVLPDMSLPQVEWTHILRHEMAHVDCRDLWVKMCCEVLCIAYWWNPLVHIFRKRLNRALEIHTDMTATLHMSEMDKLAYLECLVKVARMRTGDHRCAPAMALVSPGMTALEQRFNFIMQSSTEKPKKWVSCAFAVLMFSTITFLFSFVLEPKYLAPPDEGILLTPENCYLVLREDGGYDLYADGVYIGDMSANAELPPEVPIYSVEGRNLHL